MPELRASTEAGQLHFDKLVEALIFGAGYERLPDLLSPLSFPALFPASSRVDCSRTSLSALSAETIAVAAMAMTTRKAPISTQRSTSSRKPDADMLTAAITRMSATRAPTARDQRMVDFTIYLFQEERVRDSR
jgi:hypothetical protein